MSSDVGWHIWDKLETNAEARFNIASSETRRLVRTDSEGRPPRLSHSSWTMVRSFWCTMLFVLVLNPDTERALTEHRSPIFHQWLFQADSRCKLCSYLLHASLAVEEASRRIHTLFKSDNWSSSRPPFHWRVQPVFTFGATVTIVNVASFLLMPNNETRTIITCTRHSHFGRHTKISFMRRTILPICPYAQHAHGTYLRVVSSISAVSEQSQTEFQASLASSLYQ